MTDTTTPTEPKHASAAKGPYDDDLLVRLLVEGHLSYRKIADLAGTTAMTVSHVARGVTRRDLHERICQAVEDAQRRTRRRAAASLEAVYEKYLALALESEGETARKACEFILKTFAHAPDPAGRYIALQPHGSQSTGSQAHGSQSAGSVTDDELALTDDLKRLGDLASGTFDPYHPELDDSPPFDWTAPPRTDYQTLLPEGELALRRELAALRSNACIAYEDDYLAGYHDLAAAGLSHEQARDAGSTCLDDTWLLSAESLIGRETALIRKLAQLRLGHDVFNAHLAAIESEQTTNTAPNTPDPAAAGNPQSELHNPQLNALRQLERTHLLAYDEADRSEVLSPPEPCTASPDNNLPSHTGSGWQL